MLKKLIARLRALVAGRDVDRELDDELRFHVEIQTRTKRGVTLQQAEESLEVIARRLAAQYPDTNYQQTMGIRLVHGR